MLAARAEAKGQLPLSEYQRLRVRFFTDGAVLGTREFVNEMFITFRERFGGKRKDGARRLRYVDQKEGLYCFAELAGADHRPVSGPEKWGSLRSGLSVGIPFVARMHENGRGVHYQTENPRPALSSPFYSPL